MKNFLQNLLIFFALSLCALIAFQWTRETGLVKDLQKQKDITHDLQESIQNLEGAAKRDAAEIQRLDGLKNQLLATVKTNQQDIAKLTKDLDKVTFENERNLKQIDVYKEAIQHANENLTKQNETIRSQNEELKNLAEERNKAVTNANDLVKKFNDLADKWNKMQEDLAKAATNAPPKK
jgi:chromosome segregation ATPase